MVGDILQPSHLLFILVIALIVLGPKRLPDVGRSLGKGLRDFRSALSDNDPREDLARLNQQAMDPIHANPQAAEPVAAPAPEPPGTAEGPAQPAATPAPAPVPQPVATGARVPQGPAPDQYESD
jgi:TatA/E family protein of Tat protein translocase